MTARGIKNVFGITMIPATSSAAVLGEPAVVPGVRRVRMMNLAVPHPQSLFSLYFPAALTVAFAITFGSSASAQSKPSAQRIRQIDRMIEAIASRNKPPVLVHANDDPDSLLVPRDPYLSEIVSGDSTRMREWEWTWAAHPKPPSSPIHRLRGNDFVPTAILWAEVVFDNQSLRSAPVIINVKSGHAN